VHRRIPAVKETDVSRRNRDKRKQKKLRAARRKAARMALFRRARNHLPNADIILANLPAGPKMSEVLEELVRPFRDPAETLQSYKVLLMMGSLAWNATLVPASERIALIEKVLSPLPEADRRIGAQLLDDLMLRKERLFPENRRMIIDADVTDDGTGWHLLVASSMEAVRSAPKTDPAAGT
jgi:hypothetical protein